MKSKSNRKHAKFLEGWGIRMASVAAVLSIGLGAVACSDIEAQMPAERRARLVETFTVERHSDVREGEYVGRVRAPKEVELGFELAGRVAAMAGTTGVAYKEGEELGRLDSKRYELALEEAEQRKEYAEKELARMRALLEGGSSTQAEFDRVENAAVLARIAWERAKEDLQDCVLLAPFDGKLAAKRVDKGSFVMPGQAVLVFQEIGKTEVDFYRTERQLVELLDGLRKGAAEVKVAEGALAGAQLQLKDYATSPDPVSGAYRVTFAVNAQGQAALLPGAPLRLSVLERWDQLGSHPVEIPSDALVADPEGGFKVWLVAEGAARPESRSVEVGRVSGRTVEVLQGLNLGDRVVTSGSSLLKEDSLVAISGEA